MIYINDFVVGFILVVIICDVMDLEILIVKGEEKVVFVIIF